MRAQRVEQPVDRSMQQQPKLIGREGVATQSVGEAVVLEVLDPVLGFPSINIPVVDRRRLARSGGLWGYLR